MWMHGCCDPKYLAISNGVAPYSIVGIALRLGSDSNDTARMKQVHWVHRSLQRRNYDPNKM